MILIYSDNSKRQLKKIDNSYHPRIRRKIEEIKRNPNIGEHLSGNLKGIQSVHINPFILAFAIRGDKILILDIENHKIAYTNKYLSILQKELWN